MKRRESKDLTRAQLVGMIAALRGQIYVMQAEPSVSGAVRRACHPVIAGAAVAPTFENWGIDGEGEWSTAAMMRYRSRRDLMEIAATPEFNGPHEFKIAAMKRTIAFPIQPLFQLGEPRVLLALILFGVAAGLHLLAGRRS